MTQSVATLLVHVLLGYAALGLAFSIPFALAGAGRIDPVARGGTLGFRLVLLPGAAALWPLLLVRWLRTDGTPPEQKTPHTLAAERGDAP